jgi:hypothetical protein
LASLSFSIATPEKPNTNPRTKSGVDCAADMIFNSKTTCFVTLSYYLCVSSSVCLLASDLLVRVVDALKLSLQFYSEEYMHMNLDGIFGLRILEGSTLAAFSC